MKNLEEDYKKAYEDYIEARDRLWKIRDRITKKANNLSNLKKAKLTIQNLLKILTDRQSKEG